MESEMTPIDVAKAASPASTSAPSATQNDNAPRQLTSSPSIRSGHFQWTSVAGTARHAGPFNFGTPIVTGLTAEANAEYREHCSLNVVNSRLVLKSNRHPSYRWLTLTVSLDKTLLIQRGFAAFKLMGDASTRSIVDISLRLHTPTQPFDGRSRSHVFMPPAVQICDVNAITNVEQLAQPNYFNPILIFNFKNETQLVSIDELVVV